jgi:hypothetical protein
MRYGGVCWYWGVLKGVFGKNMRYLVKVGFFNWKKVLGDELKKIFGEVIINL